jgi:hypothetical protein
MKSNGYLAWGRFLILGLVSVCFAAGTASAQKAYRGNFTLPFDAKWGDATLPAGDYEFTLDKADLEGQLTISSRDMKLTAVVHPGGVSDQNPPANSTLIAVGSAGKYRIRVLNMAEIGKVLTFGAPKAERREMIAQAPELVRRIPVMVASR